MDFRRYSLETCEDARGLVIVIDVVRAFTTAAFAIGAGAEKIFLVSSVEEAFALRDQTPSALLMGEINHGFSIEGFDFGNSPTHLSLHDLHGRVLIQRTSAGTQGAVRSVHADRLVAASCCCASATARLIERLSPEAVSFVISGWGPDGQGDEDLACADYIEALLSKQHPDVTPFIQRVRESPSGRLFQDPLCADFPPTDLDYCTAFNRFEFVMPITRENGLCHLQPLFPPWIGGSLGKGQEA